MGMFKRLTRGRAAGEQLALSIPRWKGSPRWSAVSKQAAGIAGDVIRAAGGGDYIEVISSMRQGYEQGRRNKAFRGRRTEDVLVMLAHRAMGRRAPRAGYMSVEEAAAAVGKPWESSSSWKPAMSGKSAITEPGVRLRARRGAAAYRTWLRAHDAHITAAAQEAGIGKRDANTRAWNAFKQYKPSPGEVPSLIRAAIVGGRMESTMSAVRKPSKSVYAKRFAGNATKAENKAINAYNAQQRSKKAGSSTKKGSSSAKRSSSGAKKLNLAANICTPAGRVRKPTKVVWAKYFGGSASAAEKRHVIAYNAWKRAGSPLANTKASLSKKASSSKKKSSSPKKRASSKKTSTGKVRKPSASTYRAQFAKTATAAQKRQIQAYAAQQRAAKATKPAASKKTSKKRTSKKKANSGKPIAIRKAASSKSAAAAVVKAATSGKAMASGKTMARAAFVKKYGDDIRKAIRGRKINFFSAAKYAHEAFDRAPQGGKTASIKMAIDAASKAGLFKKGSTSAPKKRKSSAPKKRKSSKRARSGKGSQRFKVAGSVTVSAA